MTRFIYLCADDFGLCHAIDAGILTLVRQQRLNNVSCMTDSPLWRQHGPALRQYRSQLAAGLHFNLTEPLATPCWPLRTLIIMAYLRRLPLAQIQHALHRQLDRFEAIWGHPPDFVDGHQHIQLLPGLRSLICRLLQQRYPGNPPWLRDSQPAQPSSSSKHLVLTVLAQRFRQQCKARGFSLNHRLTGIYSLSGDNHYPARLQHWLQHANNGVMLMCHPAHHGIACSAPHGLARQQEFAALTGQNFIAQLHREGVTLRPFAQRFAPG